MRGVAAVVLSLAGCYSPSAGDCSYRCSAGACPVGLTCLNEFCRVPGAQGVCATDDGGTTAHPYVLAVMGSRPLVWWRFSEPPGSTVVKDEMNKANAANSGATLGVAGFLPSDRAALLSGTDCMSAGAVVDTAFTETSDFSVEAWVFFTQTSTTSPRHIVGMVGAGTTGTVGWNLQFRSGAPEPELRTCNGSCFAIYTQTPLMASRWTHVVATYAGSAMSNAARIYVDGVLANTDMTAGPEPVGSTGPLTIGCHMLSGTPESSFNGVLDEIAIYDHVLPVTEIQAHFDAAKL